MKKNKIIYWISTGLITLMMVFSAYSYVSKPEMEAAFKHLGFPDYLRVELAIAKILGALVLIIPAVPVKIKEWAYAGFAITFLSATIAHINSGDPAAMAITPLVLLVVLVISNIYLYKKNQLTAVNTSQPIKTALA
jgi:VIT1/CCC1 family predicted Fe2+/Mn2+ transporter